MKEAGFTFTIEKPDVDESFPADLPVDQVAKYLAEKKAEYFRLTMKDEVVVTADTVVILRNKIKESDKIISLIWLLKRFKIPFHIG